MKRRTQKPTLPLVLLLLTFSAVFVSMIALLFAPTGRGFSVTDQFPTPGVSSFDGLTSQDAYTKSMSLAQLRFHRFDEHDAVRILDWACSPFYDPSQHMTLLGQIANHNRHTVETELVRRVEGGMAARDTADERCRSTFTQLLSSLDERYRQILKESDKSDAAGVKTQLQEALSNRLESSKR